MKTFALKLSSYLMYLISTFVARGILLLIFPGNYYLEFYKPSTYIIIIDLIKFSLKWSMYIGTVVLLFDIIYSVYIYVEKRKKYQKNVIFDLKTAKFTKLLTAISFFSITSIVGFFWVGVLLVLLIITTETIRARLFKKIESKYNH
jgi:hypothetical protein